MDGKAVSFVLSSFYLASFLFFDLFLSALLVRANSHTQTDHVVPVEGQSMTSFVSTL